MAGGGPARAVRRRLLDHIALSIAYSGIVAGREPTAEDMEPMSWAIFSMVRKLGAIEAAGRGRAAAGVRAPAGQLPGALRRAAHARAGRAPAAARHARHRRAGPDVRRSRARACSRRSRRSSTPPASPASRCRCSRARTGCRWACSSSGARPARGRCWRWPRSWRRRAVGRAPPADAARGRRREPERGARAAGAGGVASHGGPAAPIPAAAGRWPALPCRGSGWRRARHRCAGSARSWRSRCRPAAAGSRAGMYPWATSSSMISVTAVEQARAVDAAGDGERQQRALAFGAQERAHRLAPQRMSMKPTAMVSGVGVGVALSALRGRRGRLWFRPTARRRGAGRGPRSSGRASCGPLPVRPRACPCPAARRPGTAACAGEGGRRRGDRPRQGGSGQRLGEGLGREASAWGVLSGVRLPWDKV